MLDSLIDQVTLKIISQDSKNVQRLSSTHTTITFVVILEPVLLFVEFTNENITNTYTSVLVGIPNIISQLPLRVSSSLTPSAQIQACYV